MPSNASGKYTEETTIVIYKYKKIVKELSITDFTARDTGALVQLSVKTNSNSNLNYNLWAFTPSGKWELIQNSSSNNVNWIPEEKGKYVLWASVEDMDGNSA